MVPTLDDLHAAAKRIEGVIVRTPLLRSDALDQATGAKVWIKAENLQRGGAFKMRGAANAVAALAPELRARGVLAFSSGNHAIAVSSAARIYGIKAVIVMPEDAPRIKLETTRANGAEVVTFDRVKQDREQIGAKLCKDRGLSLIKPFDDPYVIAGQGTAGLEIGAKLSPDIALAPASGGGLASGVAIALPNTQVYAVEPEGHDDIARSLRSGKLERNGPGVRSICDGLLSEQMGDITYRVARAHFAGAIVVPELAVQRAMAFAFRHLKLVLEPSGAIGVAAALAGSVDIKGKTVVIIASGGNVDAETFVAALRA